MMNNRGIKWTMLILAIVMVFGLFSMSAIADQDESVEGTTSVDVNIVEEVLLNFKEWIRFAFLPNQLMIERHVNLIRRVNLFFSFANRGYLGHKLLEGLEVLNHRLVY